MFKPLEYTESEVAKEYSKILERISKNAEDFQEFVEEIDDIIDIVETEEYLYKQAFINAVDFLYDEMLSLLYYGAIEACLKTVEFNYKPFIDTLLNAIEYHKDEIIRIIPNENTKDVKIELDFYPLGDIEEYAEVVSSVREEFLGGVKTDPATASNMWEEKYYGSAREGKRIIKKLKGRAKKGQQPKALEKDVTEEYAKKYRNTILQRMSLLGSSAPFWYLIEYGNMNMSFLNDRGGTPYPKFEGTYFIENTEFLIKEVFKNTLKKNILLVEEFVKNYLEENYGLELTKGFNVEPGLKKKILEELAKESPKIKTKKSGELLKKVTEANKVFEVYITSSGKVGGRARGAGGRFVKLSG